MLSVIVGDGMVVVMPVVTGVTDESSATRSHAMVGEPPLDCAEQVNCALPPALDRTS